jgi:flagellar P-ring protein precursor FlgI
MNQVKLVLIVMAVTILTLPSATAEMRVRDICRIKGQESNTLQGLGLVVGLQGTGDGDARPTTRVLARMMQLMGTPVAGNAQTGFDLAELKKSKNVALVFVTATIPASGAQQGDQVHCTISAISAKSLSGGYLMPTPLLGPRPGDERVYAMAQGQVDLEDQSKPTVGKIHDGCRLEETFMNQFAKTGKVMLVVDHNHASFQTAQDISELINNQPDFRSYEAIATPLNAGAIEVTIPQKYEDYPVLFVSQIMGLRIFNPQSESRVVINERAGTVIIDANVTIGAVAVSHKNITIEAGTPPFVPVDPGADPQAPKLKSLVDALNSLRVPNSDVIEIIKGLDRNGVLYGKLIVE